MRVRAVRNEMTSFDDLKILSPRPRRKLHRSQSLTTMAGAAIVANFAKLRHHNSNIERRPSIPPSLKVCSNLLCVLHSFS